MTVKHTIKFDLSRWKDWSGILSLSAVTAVFVVVVVVLLGLSRRRWAAAKSGQQGGSKKRAFKSARDGLLAHNWLFISLFTKPTYCNVCETVMVSGMQCSYCNIFVDEKCLKRADKTFKCKQVFENDRLVSEDEQQQPQQQQQSKTTKSSSSSSLRREFKRTWHHCWVKGNLKLDNQCCVCHEQHIGAEPHLSDYKCIWCWRSVHESCLNSVSTPAIVDECDFGQHSNLLLKPTYLETASSTNGSRGGVAETTTTTNATTALSLADLRVNKEGTTDTSWTPLLVLANPKSGSQDAHELLSMFTTLLNPMQVVEMAEGEIRSALRWLEANSDRVRFKILICGGDGSIGWILDEIAKLNFKRFSPGIAILPLGTGNDLSRALKWGDGYVGDVDIEDILHEVERAEYIKLDRWKVNIERPPSKISSASSPTVKYMNNYFSVGCDALVTLNFHRQRSKLFFANRLLNKLIYFKYGTIDTFMKECRTLTENIELTLDGKIVKLPHLESIVILNIPFWGGGVDPWNISGQNKSNVPKRSINDGLLEVFGVYSSFHIAQLQVGLAEPYRIGQARTVSIKLNKRFPVQIDGEPWEQQAPANITVSFFNQANMLTKVESQQ